MNLFIPVIVIVIVVASVINIARQPAGEMEKSTIATKILKAVGLYQEPQKPQSRSFEYTNVATNQLENIPTQVQDSSPSPTPLSDVPPPPPPPIVKGVKSDNQSVLETIASFISEIIRTLNPSKSHPADTPDPASFPPTPPEPPTPPKPPAPPDQ